MEAIFRRIIDNHFSDLAGTTVDAAIPVPQSLLNEIIAAALQGNKMIDACQVAIHAQNQLSVTLKTSLLPWSLHLKLKLDQSIDFASFSSPKLRAWLENNRLLGSLGSFLNVLPAGIKLYGNQVVVDLGSFLTQEQKQLLDLVKSVEIRTQEDTAIIHVKIKVE